MSLKALASETLARLRGTGVGTVLEHAERGVSCSQGETVRSTPLEHDFPQASGANEVCSNVPFHIDGTNGTGLPVEIELGLKRLRMMSTPRITNPEIWPVIVGDTLRIATDHAATALNQGWDVITLFGVDVRNNVASVDQSLAVYADGWPIVGMEAEYVTLRRSNVTRLYRNRSRPHLTKYLWNL